MSEVPILKPDFSMAEAWLAALADAAQNFFEVRYALADLLETGKELFTLKVEDQATANSGYLVVRLDPGEGLLGLVSALRTNHPEFALFEHLLSPSETSTARPSPPRDSCFICQKPFVTGELVLMDFTEGLGHRACFGEDRDGYVADLETGEPLGPDDPIPTGWPYEPDPGTEGK